MFLFRVLAGLALALGAATAGAQADPPARVATLTALEGSVVFAPAGENEWVEALRNRPMTNGDRLWSDEGARAELHLGSAAIHFDERTLLEVIAIDENQTQLSVDQGSVNARVRELVAGENFEIDTPQLAVRITQPGDFRIDVDPERGFTRVAVRQGAAVLYGESGNALSLQAGQQAAFTGTDLEQIALPGVLQDDFDQWAGERNRAEDLSLTARYLPRDVVGYPELDQYGVWSQDPSYGAVWYPQVAIADWAPYRYGRWQWIAPWGWTWIDDAPWGFAPFHYGRWALIGSRWAWVPGPLGPRPPYAPALVAFIGGQGWNLSVASGPGIGWYPLAPGEVWQPFFRASPVYVRNVNRYVLRDRHYREGPHLYYRRPDAITAVRVDDFHRGAPVRQRWSRVNSADVTRAQAITPPAPTPEARRWGPGRAGAGSLRAQPPVQFAPPVRSAVPPVRSVAPPVQHVAPPISRIAPPPVGTTAPQPRPGFVPRPEMQQREERRRSDDEQRRGAERARAQQGLQQEQRQQEQIRQQQAQERQLRQGQQRQRQEQIRGQQMQQQQLHQQQLQQQRMQQQVQNEQAIRQQQAAQELQRQQARQLQEQHRAAQEQQRAVREQQRQQAQQQRQQQPPQQQQQQRDARQQRDRGPQDQGDEGEGGRGRGRGQR